MQEERVNINGVPTKVLTWGKSLKVDSNDVSDENLNYIICIPGNPGVTEFYIEFLEAIHNETNHIVWIVGHAGHEIVNQKNVPVVEENKHLYNLQAQIQHKISFIENYVPKNAKITLIGHSIGSYMILELLEVPTIHSMVVKSYLLFPTIEYMGDTQYGKILMGYLRYFIFLLLPLVVLFNLFPLFLQNFLVYIYCKLTSMPTKYTDPIRNFITSFSIQNCVSMALEEMVQVRERNNKSLQRNINSIKLYYGASDGWAPLTYYYNLIKDIPNIDAQVCDRGFAHAFVLRDSLPMASVIANWIKTQ